MPGQLLEGIQIAETPNAEQPIARTRAQLTAFIGRTLRGPVGRPVQPLQYAGFSCPHSNRRPVTHAGLDNTG